MKDSRQVGNVSALIESEVAGPMGIYRKPLSKARQDIVNNRIEVGDSQACQGMTEVYRFATLENGGVTSGHIGCKFTNEVRYCAGTSNPKA